MTKERKPDSKSDKERKGADGEASLRPLGKLPPKPPATPPLKPLGTPPATPTPYLKPLGPAKPTPPLKPLGPGNEEETNPE